MFLQRTFVWALVVWAGSLGGRLNAAEPEVKDGAIVQFGKMHEAIGQHQSQGRVRLAKLVERPHFFGVAALENLEGEVTIVDGKVTITRVDDKGRLEAAEGAEADAQATLLVGAYVPEWIEHKVTRRVEADEFDQYVGEAASKAGLTTSKPFMFTAEGEFSNVRLHVINGACPMHARLRKIELPPERQPFEAEFDKVRGTIVGVFAKDAVGDITHPATSTHLHLVFKDAKTGKLLTGHLEQIGLLEGAVLQLPKSK
jgi:alpha-acetolactate decarboxylase